MNKKIIETAARKILESNKANRVVLAPVLDELGFSDFSDEELEEFFLEGVSSSLDMKVVIEFLTDRIEKEEKWVLEFEQKEAWESEGYKFNPLTGKPLDKK